MPIYEYKCTKHDHHFEVMHGASDPAPASCPECGDKQITKMMSRTSFQLKGSGWYATDYKSGKTKKSDGGNDSGSGSSGSGGTGSTGGGCGSGCGCH